MRPQRSHTEMPDLSHGSSHRDDRLQSQFLAVLDEAHGQIEKRFLNGGSVLMATVDTLNTLVEQLDSVTGSMDHRTTQDMVSNLLEPVKNLSQLPQNQELRQAKFNDLYGLSSITVDKIADMHVIIRYMQTFAVTAKITSASITDFSTFAEEIRERIRSGAAEVGNLDRQVASMRQQLQKALSFSAEVSSDFEKTIPDIVANLSTKSMQVTAQHHNLLSTAEDVRHVSAAFQKKISAVLSRLQVGDITRQRIEHVRDMLALSDSFIRDTYSQAHSDSACAQLKGHILALAKAQMAATVDDFSHDCHAIVDNIASFKSEAAKIMTLRDQLVQNGQDDGRGINILNAMKADIIAACALVQRVQGKTIEANDIAASVARSSHELVRGVEIIRGIQSYIHYMSLNTNLRSSKLGDSGKSVKVVSDELRKYSEQLDDAAEGIVVEFEKLSSIADLLGQEAGDQTVDLESPLRGAIETLTTLDLKMNGGLKDFAEFSLTANQRIEQEFSKLDFGSKLGDTLHQSLKIAEQMASASGGAEHSVLAEASALSAQIYAMYTMRQEREIHQRFFPMDRLEAAAKQPPAAAAPESDEDLFADALF